MNKTKLTIVTPTIGRKTLQHTVNSVLNQDDEDWKYLIVFDGIAPTITVTDERVDIARIEKVGIEGTNMGAKVCQAGVDLCETEYVGFVDDDDILTSNYVSEFYRIISTYGEQDEIIFKMLFPDGNVIPYDKYVGLFNVGMAIVLRKQFLRDKGIEFQTHEFYDWKMTNDVWENKGRIYFSDEICYRVRECEPIPAVPGLK